MPYALTTLWMLTLRMAAFDIKKRYASSVLGIFWAVGQPLLFSFAYLFVFGIFMGDGLPGRRYAGAAFIPYYMLGFAIWTLFSDVLGRSSWLVAANSSLITKVKFPHIVIAIQYTITSLLPFTVITAIGLVCLHYRGNLHMPIQFWYPVLGVVCALLLTLGFAWLIAAFSVFLPDLGQLVSVALTLGFFATPILYPLDLLQNQNGIMSTFVLHINPFTTIVEMFRAPFFGIRLLWSVEMTYTLCISIIICLLGYWVYKKLSNEFADFV